MISTLSTQSFQDLAGQPYAKTSDDASEVSEHVYGKVTKTEEGHSYELVQKAVAGTFTHIDSVAYTENRLTGVDCGYAAPTNHEGNDLTGKLYIDTTNGKLYVGIGQSWHEVQLVN